MQEQYKFRAKTEVQIARIKCPRCGGGMIVATACCAMRKKGWRTMAKCPRSGCGQRVPYERYPKAAKEKGR